MYFTPALSIAKSLAVMAISWKWHFEKFFSVSLSKFWVLPETFPKAFPIAQFPVQDVKDKNRIKKEWHFVRFFNYFYIKFNRESHFEVYNTNISTSKLKRLENLSKMEENIEGYLILLFKQFDFEAILRVYYVRGLHYSLHFDAHITP